MWPDLFFGSHAGAVRGCIFYSLACSCRNLGINFFDYISDILNKAAALPPNAPIHKCRELLPDKWIKQKHHLGKTSKRTITMKFEKLNKFLAY